MEKIIEKIENKSVNIVLIDKDEYLKLECYKYNKVCLIDEILYTYVNNENDCEDLLKNVISKVCVKKLQMSKGFKNMKNHTGLFRYIHNGISRLNLFVD